MRLVLATLVFANPVWADCLEGEDTFMSCQIEDSPKTLRVCFTPETVHYRFGERDAAPDLTLSEPVSTIDYQPWGGIGRSISEEVTFTNLDYNYVVYAGYERMFGEEEFEDVEHRHFGGVLVTRGGEPVVQLSCARETADFSWGDGLFAAGF